MQPIRPRFEGIQYDGTNAQVVIDYVTSYHANGVANDWFSWNIVSLGVVDGHLVLDSEGWIDFDLAPGDWLIRSQMNLSAVPGSVFAEYYVTA